MGRVAAWTLLAGVLSPSCIFVVPADSAQAEALGPYVGRTGVRLEYAPFLDADVETRTFGGSGTSTLRRTAELDGQSFGVAVEHLMYAWWSLVLSARTLDLDRTAGDLPVEDSALQVELGSRLHLPAGDRLRLFGELGLATLHGLDTLDGGAMVGVALAVGTAWEVHPDLDLEAAVEYVDFFQEEPSDQAVYFIEQGEARFVTLVLGMTYWF